MEQTLHFEVDGKAYDLTFTRATVIATERMGFNIGEVVKKPITSLTYLWRGAFLANHDTLTIAEVDELLGKVQTKGLLDALIDLYKAPIESLFDEDNSKNLAAWTVTKR